MPQFAPSSVHQATITFSNPKSAGFDYTASLCMGADWTVMATASFHLNAGESKPIAFSVTILAVSGTYPVYISVSSGGKVVALYKATEDVTIATVLDFPNITVLNVEGMPFVNTGVEPWCTLGHWLTYLYQSWGGYSGFTIVTNVGALTQCLLDQGVNPCTCTADQLKNGLLINACRQYLQKGPYATLEEAITSIVNLWLGPWYNLPEGCRPPGTIVFVTIAQPITMSGLRGVSVRFLNKTLREERYQAGGGVVSSVGLWVFYEPQFAMAGSPPAFTGRITSPPIGSEATVSGTGCFAAGSSPPGMYDGNITVDYFTIYPYSGGNIANFRVKSLARV